jgi:hypothetical protein
MREMTLGDLFAGPWSRLDLIEIRWYWNADTSYSRC